MEAVEVASHDLGSLAGTLLNSPIDQHKLGTPSPQVASMSATPVNGSLNSISAQAQVEMYVPASPLSGRTCQPSLLPSQLPVVLLFGTEQVPQGHVIPQAELQKIPRHVIHHILKSGQSVGEGYHKVHMLGATHLCDSLLRVKDFLNHGDYTPFTPKLDLQVVDKAGRVTTVTGPVENAEGLRTTEETYELFRKEVALYIFAGCYRYKELLLFSSHKIRTAYPVLARETFLLLEKGHRIAVQTKDQPLIDFILDATRKNSKGLTEEQGFVPLLRRSVKDDPISQILLEAHIQQAQSAKAAMDADSLLANIPVNSIPTPSVCGRLTVIPAFDIPVNLLEQSPAVKSEQSLESRITRPLVPTPSQQLFQLKEALIQERLVIAKDDGYGTLISMLPSCSHHFWHGSRQNEISLCKHWFPLCP